MIITASEKKAMRKIIADIRANAVVTGEEDTRSPADLRREQRRLLEIIDKLLPEFMSPNRR